MKDLLKVTPILRYNTPKYPAHNEPNPLQIPSKKPSKAGFYKTALLGIIGLFVFKNDGGTQTKENPIKFKELGFPHTHAMFGTGRPNRLDRESAIAIIDSVFRVNDIELQKDYGFSQGEVTFKTGGYDPELCIGYVWLDYQNTTADCHNSYIDLYINENLLPEDKKEYDKIEEKKYIQRREYLQTLKREKGYYKLLALKKYKSNHQNEVLQKEISDYLEKNPNKSDVNYGKEIYKKYTKESVDLQEIKAITEAKDYHIGTFSRYSNYAVCPRDHRTISVHGVMGVSTTNNKEKALQNLAMFVQEYIDWAKSEGRF